MPSRSTAPTLFSAGLPVASTGVWLHAHCDGGARGNPGPAGYGALLQDEQGKVVAELSEFLGIRTNNYAEYAGLLGCLQYALDHGHRRLKAVSDSELMVKQIQGKYQVKSPDLKPLFEEAKRRIARLEAFEIGHALRHKNKDADCLANEAMDRGMGRGMDGGGGPAARATAASYPTRGGAMPVAATPSKEPVTVMDQKPTPANAMLRGFTRGGVVHILGGATLPDGIFVKVIQE